MNTFKKWHAGADSSKTGQQPDFHFPAGYASILERINNIDPIKYASTRNFVNGAVTYLSPYISRGVISTRQVYESLKARGYQLQQMEKLVSELAWRDFFQVIWQAKGDAIFEDLRQPQPQVKHFQLPSALPNASTGIDGVDKGINLLIEKGYMHNHVRMYTASIACNIAGAHWKWPAQWMYYHLLDGDLASNSLSWQWVAAAFSGKKYYCNQENINKYTGSEQRGSYLDHSYADLPMADIPEPLRHPIEPHLNTLLPTTPKPAIDHTLPIILYNHYNLDPIWRKDMHANRILLLEPSHFSKHPVSEKVIEFVLAIAKENIKGIQVFTGEVAEIPFLKDVPAIHSKEHPCFTHYPGEKDSRDRLVPEVTGYFPSFFNYWKKIEKRLG
ncbi:MAG TPA: FAD-binding domain-containing protein [Phnomibacter sp.]|nr:FAD-binding domain-containing protein [Phnomibacter sp.]